MLNTDSFNLDTQFTDLAPQLNPEQLEAVEGVIDFMHLPEKNYLIDGSAGTGKTFLIPDLIDNINGKIVFTAPFNKATKVLRSRLTTQDYTPICQTTYSLLGLRMVANGAVKELVKSEKEINLRDVKLLVVDEASTVNSVLLERITAAQEEFGLKTLFLGDWCQLPPVNERVPPVWGMVDFTSKLHETMRFDSELLKLADRIKITVDHPAPTIKLFSDNDGLKGVWKLDAKQFSDAIKSAARNGEFNNPQKMVKAIAWQNTVKHPSVSRLNSLIRGQIFDNSEEQFWLPGDRIILTEPAADMDKKPIGVTDDEGTVERITITQHPVYSDFLCYNMAVITDENKRINLWVLHESSAFEYRVRQNQLANEAKLNPRRWGFFWEFSESFHKAQHGYAITAHRAQGSTYDSCYVAWNDILQNRNRNEAFRCLYVAATRPQRKLILGGV